MAEEDEKNFKEAVDMNKKAMCQFIQAFPKMSLLSKVLSEWKRMERKLWAELQGDFNPDNSIAETKLEFVLSQLKLSNKKNPRKLMDKLHRVRLQNTESQLAMARKLCKLYALVERNVRL